MNRAELTPLPFLDHPAIQESMADINRILGLDKTDWQLTLAIVPREEL